MKVEVAVLGSPSLISLMVSVDVKQHLKKLRAQEVCESRDGRPGLPVPKSLRNLCGSKATLNLNDEEESISSSREVDIVAPLVAWLSHWPRHAKLWPASQVFTSPLAPPEVLARKYKFRCRRAPIRMNTWSGGVGARTWHTLAEWSMFYLSLWLSDWLVFVSVLLLSLIHI